eukprot:967675-Pyramimonas_sp.AAC.1
MAPSRSCGTTTQARVKSFFEWETAVYKSITGMRDIHYTSRLQCPERLAQTKTALRTALAVVASLPTGGPPMTSCDVPTKKGTLQITSASRLSPMEQFALQYLIRNSFRFENVVSV